MVKGEEGVHVLGGVCLYEGRALAALGDGIGTKPDLEGLPDGLGETLAGVGEETAIGSVAERL